MKRLISYGLFLIIIFLIASCGMNKDEVVPEIISITPSNGATGVAKTTSIQVEFSEPMDTVSCESRFGLHMGELTSMPMMMGTMMDGLSGDFSWNEDHTEMTFHPDSTLMDSTMYSICLQEGMQMHNHDGEMMMSGMMNYGTKVEGGIIFKFTTE